ncbi:MAG: hypothetical protein EHM47_05130 [Ignavibacteriales bacterium]|nr:MAG: hypothetical protein EHM47_05130 [Ignavibacteriales bacterium]
MKLLILVFILLFADISLPQEQNKIKTEDSFKINNIDKILYQLDEFEFYTYLTQQKRAIDINPETVKLWLNASIDVSDRVFSNDDLTPRYLHSSLYDQYLEKSKLNPLRYALGLIQAGAAGYLAYKHIKKYVIKK